MPSDYRKIYAIKQKYKQQILKACCDLPNTSGIYFLTRTDEDGISSFYIGQSVKMLDRMVSHMQGWQHIDISLRKRSFYDKDKNPYGWNLNYKEYPIEKLDEMEQFWILEYQKNGYQARYNKTSGSQGKGKEKINEYRPARGYYDGIVQGKISLARELRHIIDLHLELNARKGTKTAQKAYEKFMYLIDENTYKKD